MEGPASVMFLRTCYIKDCKPLHFAEKPSELGQSHLSRNCGCSRRMMKQRRSNSISMCTLPIIPEYPGFQDFKATCQMLMMECPTETLLGSETRFLAGPLLSRNHLETSDFNRLFQDLERGKSSLSQLNNFPNRASLVHCLGSSSRGYLRGHPTTSSGFHDKPLQEYFNERLMELRNYESKRSNRKTNVFADKNQNPFLTGRGSRRRSSCSAVVMIGHGKESEDSCSSANQDNKKVIKHNNQEETQNVLDLYEGDFLDVLTMHIAAPLEAFVQKK